jgi:hypothetical protein
VEGLTERMRGYLIHHRSCLYDGVRADYYRNDPYVWFDPYLWSFCHLKTNPRIEKGMTVLWLSKAEGTIVCDLVFVVGDILPFKEACAIDEVQDRDLAWYHFHCGATAHPEVMRDRAKTYVADMERSYIPHPAVALEDACNAIRQRENPLAKPLATVFRRPSVPLRVTAIDELESLVAAQAQKRLTGALRSPAVSPG